MFFISIWKWNKGYTPVPIVVKGQAKFTITELKWRKTFPHLAVSRCCISRSAVIFNISVARSFMSRWTSCLKSSDHQPSVSVHAATVPGILVHEKRSKNQQYLFSNRCQSFGLCKLQPLPDSPKCSLSTRSGATRA